MLVNVSDLKNHPLNSVFGDLSSVEYDSLKKDIKIRGVMATIDITEGNVIVCGHQRIRACRDLGIGKVEARVLTGWDDDRVNEHLIKDNILRRQLTCHQVVVAGRELEKIYQGRQGGDRKSDNYQGGQMSTLNEGTTRDLVAKDFSISGRTYERYKKAEEVVEELEEPRLKEQWKQGKVKAGVIIREHKKQKQKKKLTEKTLEPPKGKYDVIVIDPPWNYTSSHDPGVHDKRGLTDYPTLTTQELMKLKLPYSDDCVLWLWTTNAFMKDAYKLLEAWGFDDKTILTWDKQFLGAGYWLRNVTEHCILAVKGQPYFNNKTYTTLISEKRTEHSTKPEAFYVMVDRVCAGRKLDYFARKKRQGWDSYGDEVK